MFGGEGQRKPGILRFEVLCRPEQPKVIRSHACCLPEELDFPTQWCLHAQGLGPVPAMVFHFLGDKTFCIVENMCF